MVTRLLPPPEADWWQALTNLISLHDLTTSRAAQCSVGFLGGHGLWGGDDQNRYRLVQGVDKKVRTGSEACLLKEGLALYFLY